MIKNISKLNQNEIKQIIQTLKIFQPKITLKFQTVLSILLNRQLPTSQIKIFLKQNYGQRNFNCLNMNNSQIYKIANQAADYIKHKKSKQQKDTKNKTQIELLQQLKYRMRARNIGKQILVKEHKQQIQKSYQKLVGCREKSEFQKQKKYLQDLKLQLGILQDIDDEQSDLINEQIWKKIELIKQKNKKNIQQDQNQKKQQEQLLKKMKKVNKKLELIFEHYRKRGMQRKDTFQNKLKICKQIDLKVIIQFVKEFEILNQSITIYQVLNTFKKLSKNGFWLQFKGFSQLIFTLFRIKYTKLHNNQEPKIYDVIQDISCNVTSPEKIHRNLKVLDKQREIQPYKFYAHSGKTKEEIIQQVKLRKQFNSEKKLLNVKRQSISKKESRNPIKNIKNIQTKDFVHQIKNKQKNLTYKSIHGSQKQIKLISPQRNIVLEMIQYDQQDQEMYSILNSRKNSSSFLPPINKIRY